MTLPSINPLNAELNPICHLLILLRDLTFMGKCIVSITNRCNVTQFIYIWKLLCMFRVVLPPIIRSAYNCIYSIWYLSHRYCYLPLSWKSWNRLECAVDGVRHPQHTQAGSNSSTIAADSSNGVRHPQHTQTGSNSSTIAADSSNGVTNTRCCRYSCMRS